MTLLTPSFSGNPIGALGGALGGAAGPLGAVGGALGPLGALGGALGPLGAVLGAVLALVTVAVVAYVANEASTSGRGLDSPEEWEINHSVWMDQLHKDFEDSWPEQQYETDNESTNLKRDMH